MELRRVLEESVNTIGFGDTTLNFHTEVTYTPHVCRPRVCFQFGCATNLYAPGCSLVLCWSLPPITAACQPIVTYHILGRT